MPYSDNRLTELLRDALGGRSKTVVVVAARLEPPNAAETLHALRFGERCRQVSETVGGSTMSTAVGLIEALTARIAECEAAIEAKERWETRTETTMQETTNPFTGQVCLPIELSMPRDRADDGVVVAGRWRRRSSGRLCRSWWARRRSEWSSSGCWRSVRRCWASERS